MRNFKPLLLCFLLLPALSRAQYKSNLNKAQWVDSVFNSLTNDQRIAQLMVIRAHSNLGADHVTKVVNDIQKYNVGALCFFQGGPIRQANLTNYYQSIAKTRCERQRRFLCYIGIAPYLVGTQILRKQRYFPARSPPGTNISNQSAGSNLA